MGILLMPTVAIDDDDAFEVLASNSKSKITK